MRKLDLATWGANIPPEMKALHRWVAQRNKKPLEIRTGKPASGWSSGNGASFEEASAWYEAAFDDAVAGLGFVFVEADGLVFIDLDNVLGEDGKFTEDGARLVKALGLGGIQNETYVETSISGRGLHVFGYGKLERPYRQSAGAASVEMYDSGRYGTVSGHVRGVRKLGNIQARLPIAPAEEKAETQIPYNPEDLERLPKALDVLARHYRALGELSYPEWIANVVSPIQGTFYGTPGWSEARKLFAAFTKGLPGYQEGDERKLDDFKRMDGNRRTVATIFGCADEVEPSWREKPTPKAGGLILMNAEDVVPEKIDWLWEGYLALGYLTLVAGDPGRGKSIATLDIAARVSSGAAFPEEKHGREPARVLYLNAEDGQGDVIRPRLDPAGAALNRFILLDIKGGSIVPQLPDDVAELKEAISKLGNVRLVVIDPINAFLGARVKANDPHSFRQALTPLVQLAAELHIAVIVVAHLNKNQAQNVMYRVSGTHDQVATVRFGFQIWPNPNDEKERVLATFKNNLSEWAPTLGFKVEGWTKNPKIGHVKWSGAVEVTAQEAAHATMEHAPKESRGEKAKGWLETYLGDKRLRASEVFMDGKDEGYSEDMIKRASLRLGVKKEKEGKGWWWSLPAFTVGKDE